MSARAPKAIYDLWAAIEKAIPTARLGGIVGDTAHSFGYHLARRDLPSGDYSVQLAKDRLGASDCASALDVSLSPGLMVTCTSRLLAAAKARDPRLAALREFCGTINGNQTYPWDLSTDSSEGVNTWDSSHLWHIHLSFYREYADNAAALLPIADVFAGVSTDWLDMATLAEVEALMHKVVRAELNAGVTVNYIRGFDNNDADPTTRDAHQAETFFIGIKDGNYSTVGSREIPAAKP